MSAGGLTQQQQQQWQLQLQYQQQLQMQQQHALQQQQYQNQGNAGQVVLFLFFLEVVRSILGKVFLGGWEVWIWKVFCGKFFRRWGSVVRMGSFNCVFLCSLSVHESISIISFHNMNQSLS